MDSETLVLVLMAGAGLAIGLGIWAVVTLQRRRRLRARFGPEYERTVEAVGKPAEAEALLQQRVDRVSRFTLRPLSSEQAAVFSREWRRIQGRFVDDPDAAVADADALVAQVMEARGYPPEDFERRADDVSVDHPHVVEHYRTARRLMVRRERGEAGTEELRQAVVNYRALFDELLEGGEPVRRRAS